jgi:hypothetical protein
MAIALCLSACAPIPLSDSAYKDASITQANDLNCREQASAAMTRAYQIFGSMPKRLIIPLRSGTHLPPIADDAMQQNRTRREARPEDEERDHEDHASCRRRRP